MTAALLFGLLLLQIKCPALKRRDSSSYLCSSAAAKRFNHRHHLHNKLCSTTANNNDNSSLSHFTFQSSLFNLFNQVQHYHHHHRINFDLFVILLCSLIRSVSQPVQSAMESSQQSSHRSHLVNKRRRKMQSWSASSSNERSLRFQRLKTNLNLAFSTMLLLSLLLHPAHSQLSANQSNLFKTIENKTFFTNFFLWTF